MILLNTTFCVDSNIAGEFIAFISDDLIPEAIKAGLYAPLLTEVRVPSEVNAITGQPTRTFAFQLRAPSASVADTFRNQIAPGRYNAVAPRWGMGLAMFDSTLDVIHDPGRK